MSGNIGSMPSDRAPVEDPDDPLTEAPETCRLPRLTSSFPPEHTEVTQRIQLQPRPVSFDRIALAILTGPSAGRVYSVGDAEITLGRTRGADVHIDDLGVSRRHARIRRIADFALAVEDLSSSNGTFVNGRSVQRAVLQSGDRVQLGPNIVLRVWLTDDGDAELQRQLYEGATRDPVTGIYNRAHGESQLEVEVAFARRHGSELSVLVLDVDRFKQINDAHGHPAGDSVLRELAARLVATSRLEDVVARWGGEEFLILLRATSVEQAAVAAERMRAFVAETPFRPSQGSLGVTVSIGVAALGELPKGATGIELVGLADKRLYAAKAAGRNRVVTASSASA
jgi:diguanylate cyclase (GGDEF)-like protein